MFWRCRGSAILTLQVRLYWQDLSVEVAPLFLTARRRWVSYEARASGYCD
jgi:hypothetical protein